METTQAQQLKLNVTNINSFLVNSNKELRRLRVEKNRLFDTQEKQIKVKEKENRIEKKDFGIGSSFSKIKSAVSSATGSIFDKIKEFFGLILLGILVNNLPRILSQLEDFFNSPVIKTIGSIISVIGNGIMTFAKIAIEFPKSAQTQFLKTKDDLEKKFDELEGIYSALIPDLEKYNQQKNGQPPSTQTPTTTPVKPGQPLNPQTNTRIPTSPTAPGTTTLPAFATGGTVKPESNRKVTSPAPGGGQTGKAKQARQASDQGFAGFKVAVDNINENTKLDESNATSFAKMSYNFKTLTDLMGGEKPSTTPPGSTPPGQTSPESPQPPGSEPSSTPTSGSLSALLPYGKPQFTSGYKTTSRPGHMGVDLGVDANSPVINTQDGKVVDIYRSFGGHGDAVVVQYNDGFRGIYGHINASVRIGDQVKRGSTIGKVKYWPGGHGYADNTHLHYERVNPKGQHVNPSGYVNGLEPPKTNIKPAQLVQLNSPKADPQLKGLKLEVLGGGKGGGKNLSYNKSSMGGKNVMIMAIQPVETFIPMPYPMPVENQSSSESSDQYQVSSIWRA
jgi:murein DD-endopeptidase MepM/ murein hydrolase activator NlpD